MAMMIKEYVGSKGIEVTWNHKETLSTKESALAVPKCIPNSLMVEHESIHVGPTRNFTWYTEEALRGSINTWTYPYYRPVIKHHNEVDGDIIGRVIEASYEDKSQLSNTGYLRLVANIPGEADKADVQNGLHSTVSIGAIIHEATCSICGQNIAEEGPCEHERGQEYDGKTCYWVIHKMEAKELSYVIVPSDKYAQVTKYWINNKSTPVLKESFEGQKGDLEMNKKINGDVENNLGDSVKGTKESVILEEEGLLKGDTTKEEPKAAGEETPTEEPKEAPKEEPKEEPNAEGAVNEELENAVKMVDELKKQIEELTSSLEDVKAQLTTKEAALQKEIQAREALETTMLEIQEAQKDDLVKKVCSIKESLGLTSNAEKLKTKSIEFLKESLEEYQEALSVKESSEAPKIEDPIKLDPISNPSITESAEENIETSVKESCVDSNTFIDKMANIMSLSMGSRNY